MGRGQLSKMPSRRKITASKSTERQWGAINPFLSPENVCGNNIFSPSSRCLSVLQRSSALVSFCLFFYFLFQKLIKNRTLPYLYSASSDLETGSLFCYRKRTSERGRQSCVEVFVPTSFGFTTFGGLFLSLYFDTLIAMSGIV